MCIIHDSFNIIHFFFLFFYYSPKLETIKRGQKILFRSFRLTTQLKTVMAICIQRVLHVIVSYNCMAIHNKDAQSKLSHSVHFSLKIPLSWVHIPKVTEADLLPISLAQSLACNGKKMGGGQMQIFFLYAPQCFLKNPFRFLPASFHHSLPPLFFFLIILALSVEI